MIHQNALEQFHANEYSLYNGDCCEVVKSIPSDSIHLSVFSPPFKNLYIYSDSERDMGNCLTDDEFFGHFKFLAVELLRVTIPGRLVAIHCKDLPLYFGRDEATGLNDFPGDIIRLFESVGFTFHSRVTIWKCPVVERERTNNNGLLHKTILRDRSQVRQGMADYMIILRKVPNGKLESDVPVRNEVGLQHYHGLDECDPRTPGSFHPSKFARKKVADDDSINIWRRYAEPVWWDIDQQEVLNKEIARGDKDEKHICPLQLDVIRRSIELWTNPGEVVLSPFAGIGSEGYVAIELGRKFLGVELSQAYYRIALRNLAAAEQHKSESDLFSSSSPNADEIEPDKEPESAPAKNASAFLSEVASVCRKHGISLSHEDTHGAFQTVEFSEENEKWLLDAKSKD